MNKRGGTKLYTGSHPHNEHIHVEITEEAGRKETPFFSDMLAYLPAWRNAAGWPEHDPDLNLDDDPDVPASIMADLMTEDYDDAPSSGTVSAFTASNARLERVEIRAGSYEWDETYWGVNVREGANAYWVTLIFDVELLVTGAVRCDGVEVSVEVPLRQTDVKMDFALQTPLEYVDLSGRSRRAHRQADAPRRLRRDPAAAVGGEARGELQRPLPALGNTNKSNEARRWWAAHEEVRVKMEIVREMLRDAPRLCAERLPIDPAEGGAANVQNESWVQEGAVFDPDAAYDSYARLLLSPHNDELVVSSSKRPAASLRSATAAADLRGVDSPTHLARGAAPPLRRPLRRRRAPAAAAGSPGTPSLDALDAWAASLNASTPNYNGTRWLAKCLRWHAYDYATCGVEKESADERFVVCAGAGWDGGARYIEPRQRGGVAGRCCRRRSCRAGGSSSSTLSPAAP